MNKIGNLWQIKMQITPMLVNQKILFALLLIGIQAGVTYRTQRQLKAHLSKVDRSQKLETWSALCNLQAAKRVGWCLSGWVQLLWASSRQLGWSSLLLGISVSSCIFQAAGLVSASFFLSLGSSDSDWQPALLLMYQWGRRTLWICSDSGTSWNYFELLTSYLN